MVTGRTDPWQPRLPPSCLVLLPAGFTEPSWSPSLLVRSYRTVSPLPREPLSEDNRTREAVYFLWHFPGPRGRWALPTTVPFGARTFLDGQAQSLPPRLLGPLRSLAFYAQQTLKTSRWFVAARASTVARRVLLQ